MRTCHIPSTGALTSWTGRGNRMGYPRRRACWRRVPRAKRREPTSPADDAAPRWYGPQCCTCRRGIARDAGACGPCRPWLDPSPAEPVAVRDPATRGTAGTPIQSRDARGGPYGARMACITSSSQNDKYATVELMLRWPKARWVFTKSCCNRVYTLVAKVFRMAWVPSLPVSSLVQ
jgi:hypothetical protein